jgi:hypothetical protein
VADVDVAEFVVPANFVDVTGGALAQDEVGGATVVLRVQPVAHPWEEGMTICLHTCSSDLHNGVWANKIVSPRPGDLCDRYSR